MNTNEYLIKNIKYLMKNRGMTQKELAQKLNYEDANSVNQWLNKRNVPDKVVEEIANIFELSIDILKNSDLEIY